jgi:hypothetical protein
MAKSSPEKLARALRANLKRRKQTKAADAKEPTSEPAAKVSQKPPKTEG